METTFGILHVMIYRSSRPEVFFSIKLQAQACKKKTLEKVFSCEFCEIYKNTSFTEHIWMSASGFNH